MALITPKQVIDTAFTNKNTDKYLVKPAFVEIAELNFVQPAIGEKLYEQISEEVNNNVQYTWVDVECKTVAGSTNVVLATSVDYIEVNDFVTSIDLPLYEDSGNTDGSCCRGFNKVVGVTVSSSTGLITAFTISGAAKTSNNFCKIKIRKPNGVLLEDYIQKYLAFGVKFEMMPDMSYNTTSQGVVENVADFTMPVDSKKLNFLRNETFKKSDTYQRRMTEFLNENDEAYPDYCNDNKGGVSKLNGIILY
tara:strand:+ start:2321 stop:3070 length:750 start_codon:yes stop_codon:yes gene_type:complete